MSVGDAGPSAQCKPVSGHALKKGISVLRAQGKATRLKAPKGNGFG
jgi:hypothetical protein